MSSWWTYERICATVTADYVIRMVGIQKQRMLYEPLRNGDGLNESIYLGWITSRCKRLFLILHELDCPEKIFSAVDKCLEDGDLPMSEDEVDYLDFETPALRKRFLKLQYTFIVQELEEGTHVRYAEQDVVPVEVMSRPRGIPAHLEKVRVKDRILWRRRIALKENAIEKIHFEMHFKLLMQRIRHQHLTSVWATYIQGGMGYILLRPSCDLTLAAFLDGPPKAFRILPPARQRQIVIHWFQCLTTALAFLHVNDIAHMVIRPSNIFIDNEFRIYLGAHSMLGGLEDSKKPAAYNKESYRYGAPEQWHKHSRYTEPDPLRTVLQAGGRTRQRIKPQDHQQPHRQGVGSPPPPYPSSLQYSQLPPGARVGMDGYDAHNQGLQTFLDTPVPLPPAARPPALVTTMNYYPPNLERSQFDPAPYFPSDVFTLSVILVELLSLLAVNITGHSGLQPSKIPDFLGRLRTQAGRGGAVPDQSFHANLSQADAWLSKLEEAIGPSNTRRRLSLGRRNSRPENDEELWRWRGASLDFIHLVRHGLQKERHLRWTAPSGATVVHSILGKWHIEPAPCCTATPLGSTIDSSRPLSRDSDPHYSPGVLLTPPLGAGPFAIPDGLSFDSEPDRPSTITGSSSHCTESEAATVTESVVPSDVASLDVGSLQLGDGPEAVVAVQPSKLVFS